MALIDSQMMIFLSMLDIMEIFLNVGLQTRLKMLRFMEIGATHNTKDRIRDVMVACREWVVESLYSIIVKLNEFHNFRQ